VQERVVIKPQAVESSSGCRGDGATHAHRADDVAGSVRNGEPTTTDTDDASGLDRRSNRRTGDALCIERAVRECSAVLADESGDAVWSVLHGTSLVVALADERRSAVPVDNSSGVASVTDVPEKDETPSRPTHRPEYLLRRITVISRLPRRL
jgi:hypothetical protein